LNAVVQDRVPDHKEIDLPVGGLRLSGRLSGLYPTGRIQARFADRKAGDLLTAWVAHVLLNIDPPAGCAPVTTLVNRDTVTRFKALAHAETVLNTLLDVYWEGLSMPLHFFPETAWAYSRVYYEKGRVAEEALDAARKKWLGDAYYRGEIQSPYNLRCFENADPLDQRFRELAERIYYPIFEHLTEIVM
jgi:exodeoxyribonuclease V gamma subunit